MLIHQIPSKPTYFRAKVGRRLKQVGAIPVKQAVYTLPDTEQCLEDLTWIAKEISDRGGEAVVLSARFIDGLTDAQVRGLFENARRADYEKVLNDARALMDAYHAGQNGDPQPADYRAELGTLKKAFNKIVGIDFFPPVEQEKTEAYLDEMETIFFDPGEARGVQTGIPDKLSGCTWVTKRNVYVDRMASAWFILRFIDRSAAFKFIDQPRYQPDKNELRFDMREAEFTHQGDMCTFEVLIRTFRPRDRGLGRIAKLIHDIDLKEDAFGLPEKAGIQAVIDSIVATTGDDMERIEKAGAILDGLLVTYTNRL